MGLFSPMDWSLAHPDPRSREAVMRVKWGHTESGAPCYWIAFDDEEYRFTYFSKRKIMKLLFDRLGPRPGAKH